MRASSGRCDAGEEAVLILLNAAAPPSACTPSTARRRLRNGEGANAPSSCLGTTQVPARATRREAGEANRANARRKKSFGSMATNDAGAAPSPASKSAPPLAGVSATNEAFTSLLPLPARAARGAAGGASRADERRRRSDGVVTTTGAGAAPSPVLKSVAGAEIQPPLPPRAKGPFVSLPACEARGPTYGSEDGGAWSPSCESDTRWGLAISAPPKTLAPTSPSGADHIAPLAREEPPAPLPVSVAVRSAVDVAGDDEPRGSCGRGDSRGIAAAAPPEVWISTSTSSAEHIAPLAREEPPAPHPVSVAGRAAVDVTGDDEPRGSCGRGDSRGFAASAPPKVRISTSTSGAEHIAPLARDEPSTPLPVSAAVRSAVDVTGDDEPRGSCGRGDSRGFAAAAPPKVRRSTSTSVAEHIAPLAREEPPAPLPVSAAVRSAVDVSRDDETRWSCGGDDSHGFAAAAPREVRRSTAPRAPDRSAPLARRVLRKPLRVSATIRAARGADRDEERERAAVGVTSAARPPRCCCWLPNRPRDALVGPQHGESMDVIEAIAARLGAKHVTAIEAKCCVQCCFNAFNCHWIVTAGSHLDIARRRESKCADATCCGSATCAARGERIASRGGRCGPLW